jgi:ABC-type glycerol-3-phosphate transport system permease component
MDKTHFLIRLLIFSVLLVMSVSFIYPPFYLFVNSFKTRTDYQTDPFSIPRRGHWEVNNIIVMISNFKILHLFKNSAIVMLGSCSVTIVLAIFASYAFAKLRFWRKQLIYMLIISSMFIPAQITMIPMYAMFARLKLINNFLSVILAYLAGYLPSNILLMTANFRGIPNELIESSKIDGCSYFQIVQHVIVPIGRAAIIINIIFNAIYMWNDLFTPMILLQKMEVRTVMPALAALMRRYTTDPTFQIAGLFLSSIPALIIYIVFQKYIIGGITVGAIK